ncbi:MAG: hypothetical protein K0V04_15580 [Deltaproteobacteria bacterium]|nr:hypothetical protein [Deltaproteobacteria bacterium]
MRPPNSEPSFGVGNYRSSSRPGQVGRIVSPTPRGGLVRPHQAWKRRAGFVGQGSAAPSNKPAQPATAMVVTPGTYNPPVAIPIDPGATGGGTTVGGQCGTAPPYPCPSGMDPRWWDYNRGCPIDHAASMGCTDGVTMYCDTEQPCGVNVIGANTLGTDGIPPGEVVPLNITAGDATRFRTKAIYFEAQPFRNPDLIDTAVLPPGRSTLPVILVDALVGRISQLRRGGSPDVGLTQGGYSNTKELVPTDWAPFTSTTEHNLALLFFNPNADVTIHVFVDLWGDI